MLESWLSPCTKSKKENTHAVFKGKVAEDLSIDSDKEPEGTVSEVQKALADAEEKVTAADAKSLELRDDVK